MSLAHILNLLWAIGVFAFVIFLLKMIYEMGDYWGMLAGFLIIPILGLYIAVLPYSERLERESSTLATLTKKEWRCTEKENVKTVQTVKGETIYSNAEVCKRYERID